MKEIIIATKNAGKAKEFVQMFAPMGFAVKTLLDYPEIEDVEETGTTFEENAIIKAETVAKQLGAIVISDDSGLMIDALDGKPGVYSARYAGARKNDEENMVKVLEELNGVPTDKRTARFCCTIAVANPKKKTLTFTGTCEGLILEEKRGEFGFGYDPIFYVVEEQKSMAELPSEIKNQISHRADAIKKLKGEINSVLKEG
ncbi:XTP/dITP diphosphatase [Niallia sp. NCCP-28]|uniref:XTP/dITP diphosphatase n=1 Tax=Niallia sp. NCCP-28 TaxID=2934712 RepID=UPI00207FAC5E|nr:XTP/dITP diphosphatase [Niallia sp. NCCP-28]GKU81490.1 non-canonical purine NTP pyrophosphatase [Niallia sp. NCCP-28]